MFDKIKQLNDLRKLKGQADELQKELAKIKETIEDGNIRIRVNGEQKVEYLEIDGVEMKDLVEVINKAMKEVQKKSAKKMMEMGGGLMSMLGGGK